MPDTDPLDWEATNRSQRSLADASEAKGLGIATTNHEQRTQAALGLLDYAQTSFANHASVMNAGVLLALPALLSQGLDKAFKVFNPLPNGYYGLHHIVLLSCFMALCRIKNVEQLKEYPPGELGKLLGLDRIPEVGHLRKKYKQIFSQNKSDQFHKELFSSWVEHIPDMLFYIDGHVRIYHGRTAKLTKRYVSRQKLCLNGTTEFWVNDQQGQPLLVVTAELNEKLKQGVEQLIPQIEQQVAKPKNDQTPRFTIVLDRESYEPTWYRKLWDEQQIAVITYRKNVKDKWPEDQFKEHENTVNEHHVSMRICERGVQLNKCWFREIRILSASAHQTAIITTQWQESAIRIAHQMVSRWAQENFFKYMISNFDFDKAIEYGTQQISPDRQLVNPEYRRINNALKKSREKKRRLEAKVYEKMEALSNHTIEQAQQHIGKSSNLFNEIENYELQITDLLQSRCDTPYKIKLADMPHHVRHEKLKQESKKFKNAIIMLAYRAETALYNTLHRIFKDSAKQGRALLREIFKSDADLQIVENDLIVTIHSLSTPRYNQALIKLCEIMNETQTAYPLTKYRLIYKSVAQNFTKD